MLIDLPVMIIFDCQSVDASWHHEKGIKKLVTLRFDTEKPNEPAQIARGYLPEDKTIWQADPAELVLGQLMDKDLQEIARRAAVDPYDYLAGTFTEEQRQAAQDEADRKDAEDGPSE